MSLSPGRIGASMTPTYGMPDTAHRPRGQPRLTTSESSVGSLPEPGVGSLAELTVGSLPELGVGTLGELAVGT